MDKKVEQLVKTAILELIQETVSDKNIARLSRTHELKVHFIPVRYRILGGLIQSLNIKFGNFIEKLVALIIETEKGVEALPESGKKLNLSMTQDTDSLIDQYITQRQLPNSPDKCDPYFSNLLATIIQNEGLKKDKQTIRKDVDAIFRTNNGQIVYLEIKYNDDHDTGKFVDINRKFIKTYAGLVNHFSIKDIHEIKPIIYYFNPVKRWGPIYVPSTNIYRGDQLFEEFFDISYSDVDSYIQSLGSEEEIIEIFDQLYRTVRHRN